MNGLNRLTRKVGESTKDRFVVSAIDRLVRNKNEGREARTRGINVSSKVRNRISVSLDQISERPAILRTQRASLLTDSPYRVGQRLDLPEHDEHLFDRLGTGVLSRSELSTTFAYFSGYRNGEGKNVDEIESRFVGGEREC